MARFDLLREITANMKLGRPKNPVPPERSYLPEKMQTPNTLLHQLTSYFPFDPGLITSTGKSQLEEKNGLEIFEEISRDPQVRSCMAVKRAAITNAEWAVEPADETPEAQEIAEAVEWNLQCLLGPTGIGLKSIIQSAFLYGRSVHEIIWEVIQSGPYQGLYKISQLKPKNVGMISFEQDTYCNIINLLVSNWIFGGKFEKTPTKVDPFKVVHYNWNTDLDNPYGVPDLTAVYPWWWAKKTYYKYGLVFGDKFASPIPEFKIDRKLTEAEEQKLKDSAKEFHISNSFLTPKGVELVLHQNNGTGGIYYINTINQLCDAQIARGILSQTLTTNENSKTGTFAQAEVHQNTLSTVVQEIQLDVAKRVVTEQLIKRFVLVNYGEQAAYPRFRFNPLDAAHLGAMADSITKLTEAKDDVGNSLVDPKEEWVRKSLKLPKRDTKAHPYRTKPLQANTSTKPEGPKK